MNHRAQRVVIFGLMVLLVAVVSAIAWYAKREREIAPQRHFTTTLTGAGAVVGWERAPSFLGQPKCTTLSFAGTANASHVNDELLAGIFVLEDLERLDLTSCSITDASVKPLSTLKKLRWLSLRGTPLKSAGIIEIAENLPELEYLDVRGTDCDIAGAAKVREQNPEVVVLFD